MADGLPVSWVLLCTNAFLFNPVQAIVFHRLFIEVLCLNLSLSLSHESNRLPTKVGSILSAVLLGWPVSTVELTLQSLGILEVQVWHDDVVTSLDHFQLLLECLNLEPIRGKNRQDGHSSVWRNI